MSQPIGRLLILSCTMFLSLQADAFRSCEVEHSDAYLATTQYSVTEIFFDVITGMASGTETIYNHTNDAEGDSIECHVTYELAGSIEPVSGVMVFDAHRTNHSVSCPVGEIAYNYPEDRFYSLLVEFSENGKADVRLADSGELIAGGDWSDGVASYRTGEVCSLF
ncbi:MAG: hypothetical protein V7720_05065 [Halioglobus sp.]